eukprot:4568405-Amphidinium_carterae.1
MTLRALFDLTGTVSEALGFTSCGVFQCSVAKADMSEHELNQEKNAKGIEPRVVKPRIASFCDQSSYPFLSAVDY